MKRKLWVGMLILILAAIGDSARGEATAMMLVAGRDDSYQAPVEAADPGAAWADQEGIGKQFDEVSDAKALGHTFHFEGIECRYNRAEGHITSAKLEIGLRPGGSADAAADEIALQWQGTSGDFAWRRAIGTGGADGLLAERWDAETASDCVLLLDLEDLPTADGGSVSLLDLLDQVRALDVMVGRHTSVDYMILWLETSEALTTNMILE